MTLLVCFRLIRAVRGSGDPATKSLDRYCNLESISVEEQQFCYNTQGFRSDILRMLDLGADENRICKKVHSINPDFCKAVVRKKENPGTRDHKRQRGVIYE